MANTVLNRILEEKIIAIVRGIPSTRIVELARALLAGGIHCVEVTFDPSDAQKTADTLAAIRTLRESLGDTICVGAGTVMTAEQVRLAAEAGAEYMISPNVNEAVIRETKRLGKVSIPGAMTPTEAEYAYSLGADIIKIFPAGVLGPGYLKAIRAPLRHIPFTAVGGVTVDNCADFLRAGAVGVAVGGNLVSPTLVEAGRFEEIRTAASAYVAALHR